MPTPIIDVEDASNYLEAGYVYFRSIAGGAAIKAPFTADNNTVNLPAGTYDTYITHGGAMNLYLGRVKVPSGETVSLSNLLDRLLPQGPRRSRRLGTIGTSLVQQCANSSAASRRCSYQSQGWMTFAHAHSKRRFDHPVWYDTTVISGWEPSGTPGASRNFQGINFGVSGQTIAQIVARLDYIYANWRNAFDDIIIDGGTNDMSALTAAEIQAQRELIADRFLDMGKRVILLPILARDVATWATGGVERKRMNRIAEMSREYARKRQDVWVFDWNVPWTVVSSADMVPNTNYSHDGTHFAPQGAEAVGIELASFLTSFYPPRSRQLMQDDLYDATENPTGNLLANPLCTGNTGVEGTGVTGDTATGMRTERASGSACTAVASKEAIAGSKGELQVLTITVSGTTEEVFNFATSTADTTHALGGKWVRGCVSIITNDADAFTEISLYLKDQNGTNGQLVTCLEPYNPGSGNLYLAARNRDIILETPPMLLAADSTTMRWRVEIGVKGPANKNPVIKIGDLELRVTTDPRLYVNPE